MAKAREADRENSYIVISDKAPGIPYSKGIMASSIMATGVSPDVAYRMAAEIEHHLLENNITSITIKKLRQVTYEILKQKLDEEIAQKYMRWQSLGNIGKPLIILIGGATGVGKSTLASQLAPRVNIIRVIPTDAIREVMRASISPSLIKPLRGSSYNAWQNIGYPFPEGDPVIYAFREQTQAVAVGINAVIDRAISEGTSLILEGAHIVPGYLDTSQFSKAIVVEMILMVQDEQVHMDHFLIRDIATRGSRSFRRYIENFGNIRKIQDYIVSLAREHGVKLIDCYNLDDSIREALDFINDVLKREFDAHMEAVDMVRAEARGR